VIKVFKTWIERYLSDPEAILLLVILLGGLGIILTFGDILMPVFVSIAITILLQWWIDLLQKYKCSYSFAYWLMYLVFISFFLTALFVLLPLLWKQCVNLITELPNLLLAGKKALLEFVADKHDYISKDYVDEVMSSGMDEVQAWGKKAISVSISSIPAFLTWIVYIILVPMLVFFFLKDHNKIIQWFIGFLPEKRGLIRKVWYEMNQQMGNYVRGKITEIFIVGVLTYLIFVYFKLRYAALLAFLVGLSVVIPYVGIVVATIPVLLVGYLQWGLTGGLSGEFALMLYAYSFLQMLDGAILVPLLFSEAVNLHPIAIVIAILFFGSMWGFWGVFFAIPLATLVKAVMYAWPKGKGTDVVKKHRHA
jgi:putative permease